MEKNAIRSGTCGKRLLIVILCLCSIALYGLSGDAGIEVKIEDGTFFIGHEFELEVIIRKDSPYYLRNQDIPRLLLDGTQQYMMLVQSSAAPEAGGFHLRAVYRFMETGAFTVPLRLQWRRQTLELPPLNLTVHEPPFSEQTELVWKLYTLEGKPMAEGMHPEQGRRYLLFLSAAFYTSGYGIRAEGQSAGIRTITLPPEVTYIECPAPENAVLEKWASGAPLPDFLDTALDTEEHILAAFIWTPLQTGIQPLPAAQLLLESGSKTESRSAAYPIIPQSGSISSVDSGDTPSMPVHTAFAPLSAQPREEPENDSPYSREETAGARKIAEYRRQEAAALFPYTVRRERKKWETALHIVRPLPIYPRVFRFAAAGFSLAFIAGAFLYFVKKKKLLFGLCGTAALVCTIGAGMLFRAGLQTQGVCIAADHTAIVRRIPETTGSAVHRLVPGESVFIVRKTAQWYYIRTADGIAGWVNRKGIEGVIGESL